MYDYHNSKYFSLQTSNFLLLDQINLIEQLNSKQIAVIYSISSRQIMSQISDYLQEITYSNQFQQPLNHQIKLQVAFKDYFFTVSLGSRLGAILIDKKTQKTYTIRACIKMQPKYDTSCNPSVQIIQILLYCRNQYLVLKSSTEGYLNKLYEKLRMFISHKGFNEYFKPIKRLGRGAFATVYLVQHKFTKNQFAAKVFSREGQKLQFKGHEALQNQIRTLRLLSHPNIIKYQGVYETQNLIYLVTEYLSGGNLQHFMKNKCNLNGSKISQIISDTLQGLIYLQDNSIMHRDLKPENILLRPKDMKWVLIDFGLSAFINEQYLYDKCGTMGYMAPEVLAQNQKIKSYSLECDLYSLGVISYQLIIGCMPFKVESLGIFDRKIVWNAFNTEQCLNIDSQIIQFLKGLLEKEPLKRLTAKQALKSSFFVDQKVIQSWRNFSQKRIDQRYDQILKLAKFN